MKKLSTLIAAILISINLFAQAPQKMSYQAVIRNAQNELLVNKPVKMRISILQGSTTGTSVYSELHSATTNANGLASIEIGEGTNKTGTFSAINWGNGTYFLKTETDPNNGTTYSIVGTSQLLSVPYALHSGNGVKGVSTSGDTLFLDNGKKYLIPGIKDLNAPPTLNNGLLGYWPFNNNANDESGNGNNGVVNGATLTNDRFGNTNRAYSFNGLNNSINIPPNNSFFTNDISVSSWIKIPLNDSKDIQFIVLGSPTKSSWSCAKVGNNPINFYFLSNQCGGTNNSFISEIDNGLINNWFHFTYTKTGTSIKFYVNGILISAGSLPILISDCISSNLYFGLDIIGDPEYFLGQLDDIRIYNRALTQEEITWLANN